MIAFFRRWHPLILLALGIYLAIPKPAPEAGDRFQWPLNAYRWSLGQDLEGGSSLRYKLVQQDLIDAQESLSELLTPLASHRSKLSGEALEKFGALIDGKLPGVDSLSVRESKSDKDDFDLLLIPGVFDEGRVDAARKYYKVWNDAARRRESDDLAGPTIETLNRRLNSSGITELNIAPLGGSRLEVKLPKFSSINETERYKELLETTGKLEMRVLASEKEQNLTPPMLPKEDGYRYKWLEVMEGREEDVRQGKPWPGTDKQYVLVQVIDEWDITGKDIESIVPSTNTEKGGLAVSFDFKGQAVAHFEELSDRHREGAEDERDLAVIIDDKVYAAYGISERISGSVQISGRFDRAERDDLINTLKSGSLNVKLVLEGEESVGPSEGREAVNRGLWSLVIGAGVVFLLALLLYRGLGVLTIVNLVMVVALIMGAMAAGLGTLTLPGIAGLVLTLGMAIDANILINERIREESLRGLNTRGAVEEGFKNAFSSIVDSNITTLLTALILFKVGTGPVKGFALVLAIGIVATLYTALAAYKSMVFGILDRKRDLKLSMANLSFAGETKINFEAWLPAGVVVSLILVASGGAVLATHGGSVLGMEFRGGHAFRMQFKEAHGREEIEALLLNEDGTSREGMDWAEGVELQPVFGLGEETSSEASRFDFRFPMRDEWKDEDQDVVNRELKDNLQKVFADLLVEEGWNARPADAREVSFSAELILKLADPEWFREQYPDDMDKLWKAHERSWEKNEGENAPIKKKDEWFSEVVSGSENAVVVPEFRGTSATGDRQTYVLTVQGVTVLDETDLLKKKNALRKALIAQFVDDSERVKLEGEVPEPAVNVTRGRLRAEIEFVRPVDAEEFQAAAEGFHLKHLELGGPLSVTPRDVLDGKAGSFLIEGVEADFDPHPENAASFAAVSEKLKTEIGQWVAEHSEDNQISTRFLLASAIGATVAGETQWSALLAIVAALIVVVIYIRVRFASVTWGLAAVIALIHDTLVVVGLIGLADMLGADIKIDLTVVAAILTVIGYSLNDTIINFDRLRELLKKDRLATGGKTPLRTLINQSVNQMLSRTVLTSGTTLVTTIAMLMFGGALLKGFAFTMTCGIVVGTFSSIYVAGPVLLFFHRRDQAGLLDLTEEEEKSLADAGAPSDSAEDSGEEQAEEGEGKAEPAGA